MILKEKIFSLAKESKIKELMKYINDNSIDINELDGQGYTLLHQSIYEENPDIINCLIELETDINKRDDAGFSPLELACMIGNLDIVKILIDHNCDLNKNKHVYNALHIAAAMGRHEIVDFLLQIGMDVNDVDDSGYTPLHWATQEGKLDVVELLVRKKANLEAKDNNGFAPIHIAASEGHIEIMKLFINNNVDVNIKCDGDGHSTALHKACSYNNIEIAKLLIMNNANLDDRDDDGRTPLFYAVMYVYFDLIELLLKYGANKNVVDNNGVSLLEIVDKKNKDTIIEIFNKY